MLFLRSLLFFLGQVISAIVICLLSLLLFFLPHFQIAKIIRLWSLFNLWSLKIICGLEFRVQGLANIPDQPSIILCNHQSAWETLALQKIFPAISFVLKRELLLIPFFGWGLALYKPIAINRAKKTRALDQLIEQGLDRLKKRKVGGDIS